MYIWRGGEGERTRNKEYGAEIFEKTSKIISNLGENIILQSQNIQQTLK